MHVAVCGDWHADPGAIEVITDIGTRWPSVEHIFHCGDFGWKFDPSYLEEMTNELERQELTLSFVDGNHEDFDYLFKHWKQRKRIWYMPRTTHFMLYGRTIFAMGGAHSIDKHYRTPGISWWPEEEISERDVQIALQAQKAEIVFAHDAPLTCDLELEYGYKDDSNSNRNREALQLIVDHVQPKVLFHGHYHKRITTTDHNGVQCIGLDMYRDDVPPFNQNYVVFDLATMEVL